jgi:hypothetical protein
MDENILHTPHMNLTKRTKKLEKREHVRLEVNSHALIYVMILEAIYAVNATMTVHKTRLMSLACSSVSLPKSSA